MEPTHSLLATSDSGQAALVDCRNNNSKEQCQERFGTSLLLFEGVVELVDTYVLWNIS